MSPAAEKIRENLLNTINTIMFTTHVITDVDNYCDAMMLFGHAIAKLDQSIKPQGNGDRHAS